MRKAQRDLFLVGLINLCTTVECDGDSFSIVRYHSMHKCCLELYHTRCKFANAPFNETYRTSTKTELFTSTKKAALWDGFFLEHHSWCKVEVPPGFEPGNKGFADLRLTAWLWHRVWSGRRDSNSRHPPWQGGTLPLSYYRTLGALGRNRTTDT